MIGLLRRLLGRTGSGAVVLPYDSVVVRGGQVSATIAALAKEGITGIAHGSRASREMLAHNFQADGRRVEDIIAAAGSLDACRWLQKQQAREVEDPDAPLEGEWPDEDGPVSDQPAVGHDLRTGGELAEVVISRLPTTQAWLAPCYLKFGGFNACPPPEVHAALFKRWADTHGAQVITITGDVVELQVQRPVGTREEALALAREHYLYCGLQGAESIQELAAALVGARYWFFWWD